MSVWSKWCSRLGCNQVDVVEERPEHLKTQFRTLLRKQYEYQTRLEEMRSTMSATDRFVEMIKFFNNANRPTETMLNVLPSFEIQIRVTNEQAGMVMSLTSDVVLLPAHIPANAFVIINDFLKLATEFSKRDIIEFYPDERDPRKVRKIAADVIRNKEKLDLAHKFLKKTVEEIISTMEPLKNENAETVQMVQ